MLASDRKTNRPLLVALMLEFLSRNIRRVPSTSSQLERAEYASRDRDILWYLLRGSIWETWSRYVFLKVPFALLINSHYDFADRNLSPSQIGLQTSPWSASSVLWSRTGYRSSMIITTVCDSFLQPSSSHTHRCDLFQTPLPNYYFSLGCRLRFVRLSSIHTLAIIVLLIYVLGPWPDILFCKTHPSSGEICRATVRSQNAG